MNLGFTPVFLYTHCLSVQPGIVKAGFVEYRMGASGWNTVSRDVELMGNYQEYLRRKGFMR